VHVAEQFAPRERAAGAAREPREDLVDPQALLAEVVKAQDRRREGRGGDGAEQGRGGRSGVGVCGRPQVRVEAGVRSRQ